MQTCHAWQVSMLEVRGYRESASHDADRCWLDTDSTGRLPGMHPPWVIGPGFDKAATMQVPHS